MAPCQPRQASFFESMPSLMAGPRKRKWNCVSPFIRHFLSRLLPPPIQKLHASGPARTGRLLFFPLFASLCKKISLIPPISNAFPFSPLSELIFSVAAPSFPLQRLSAASGDRILFFFCPSSPETTIPSFARVHFVATIFQVHFSRKKITSMCPECSRFFLKGLPFFFVFPLPFEDQKLFPPGSPEPRLSVPPQVFPRHLLGIRCTALFPPRPFCAATLAETMPLLFLTQKLSPEGPHWMTLRKVFSYVFLLPFAELANVPLGFSLPIF